MKLKLVVTIAIFLMGYFPKGILAEENIGASSEQEVKVITISKGIQMVLKNNHLIQIASSGDEMAYQDTLLARSALLPHMKLTATKTFHRYQEQAKTGSQVYPVADKDPFSYGFDVYQTLFDFGKSLSKYKASKEKLKASNAHRESIKRIAVLEFIVAYFDVLEAEKMISVSEKEVESLKSYLDDLDRLYEEGVIVKNDLLPAKVRLADAKQKLIETRNNRELAIAHLNNVLALPLDEKIILKEIDMQLPQAPEMEQAWKAAQEKRPEVAFYSNQMNASLASEKAIKRGKLPAVFIDGGYSYTENNYQVHEDNAYLKLGVKMDLFNGGASDAKQSKERFLQIQLSEQRDKLIEDIKFEIQDSLLGFKNAYEKVLVSKDALDQAEENVRFHRVKYNVGAATSTDVLEAITLQTKAQTNYFNADYELKSNYAKLMYSMGEDLVSVYKGMENKNELAK